MKKQGVQYDDRIVECHWDPHGGPVHASYMEVDGHGTADTIPPPAWRLHRIREDKTDGNHTSIVQKIIRSIEDGVEKDQLLAEEVAIRAAWKSDARSELRRAQAAPAQPRMGPPPPMRGTPPDGLMR